MRQLIGSKVRKLNPIDFGPGAPVRVIGNIGTTQATDTIEEEIIKAKAALKAGADIITDHSLAGKIADINYALINSISCPISSVSVYEAYVKARLENKAVFSPERAIEIFQQQASRGLDLITVHATILTEDLPLLTHSNRLIPSTSRGGMMIADLMLENRIENPYWTFFNDILKIAKEYGTTISLGTAFRPASIIDAPDFLYQRELQRMAELIKAAIDSKVSIMVEGIGHARLDIIPKLVTEAKSICLGAPYRVLCVACDSALYRDHIASAIASSVAVAAGADLISAVSRSEHIGRPNVDDIVEAVETAKIAAHCGDIVRSNNIRLDEDVSRARGQTTCLAKGTIGILARDDNSLDDYCTMCGQYCALRIMRNLIKRYG